MESLFGLGMIDSLPFPLLVGGGIVLAIASNRDKRIRILSRQRKQAVSSVSSPPSPAQSVASPTSNVELPNVGGRSPHPPKSSISFKVKP
jgi:hypothetical protein